MITIYKNGDIRQFHLYEMFCALGVEVNYSNKDLKGILILPVSGYDVKEEELSNVELIFVGVISNELQSLKNKIIVSYLSNEFLVENAKLTALGLLVDIFDILQETIEEKEFLIIGYGRCGKAIANELSKYNKKISILTKEDYDKDTARLNNFKVLDSAYGADVVINTVPSLVLDAKELVKFNDKCLLIDIASKPGGIDYLAANSLGLKTYHLLNIPGNVFPKSAAKLIYDEVIKIFKEKNI